MTGAKIQRTIRFTLEQQARFTAIVGQLFETVNQIACKLDHTAEKLDRAAEKLDRVATASPPCSPWPRFMTAG